MFPPHEPRQHNGPLIILFHHLKFLPTPQDDLFVYAKEIQAPYALVLKTKELGRLPVVNFAAGGVATPADAALMMQLGMDGVFVGSGIFKSSDHEARAAAIVKVFHSLHPLRPVASIPLNQPYTLNPIPTRNFEPYILNPNSEPFLHPQP